MSGIQNDDQVGETTQWHVRLGSKLVAAVFALIFSSPFWGVGTATALRESSFRARLREAVHWPETPCVITTSRSNTHRGVTPHAVIRYDYRYGDQDYVGRIYCIGAAERYEGSDYRSVAAALPSGTKTVCFVNPEDPVEAILNRDRVFAAPNHLMFMMAGVAFLLVYLGSVDAIQNWWRGRGEKTNH